MAKNNYTRNVDSEHVSLGKQNSILHDSTDASKSLHESPIDVQKAYHYSHMDTFAAADRVLFSRSIKERIQSSQRSKKHWLVLVTRYLETTTTRTIGSQPLLTQFFPRVSHSSVPFNIPLVTKIDPVPLGDRKPLNQDLISSSTQLVYTTKTTSHLPPYWHNSRLCPKLLFNHLPWPMDARMAPLL